MKKNLFHLFTFISMLNFGIASSIMKANTIEQEDNMVMAFFIPLLVLGLGFGVAANVIKVKQQLKLSLLLSWMHHFNLMLMFFGVLALFTAVFK